MVKKGSSQIDPKVVESIQYFKFLTLLLTFCAIIYKPGLERVSARLKFLKLAMRLVSNSYSFFVPKITPTNTLETRKPLFLNRKKVHDLNFIRKCPIVPKKVSARKTTFSQAEISFEREGYSSTR